ncbi:MAG TPA: hypothetical protein VHL58_01135 [Thermoanaerobaculia bacterium]|nr:hypothetical protein [Thermoanaerobaculia bacterium]
MKRLLNLIPLLITINVFAVTPQFWKTSSAEAFLGGEIEGMTVNSRGQLRPGPTLKKIASFSEPFVLSQASDGAGNRFFGTGNGGKVYRLSNGEMKLLFTAPEPEIYAATFADGALIVGSSPNGKVYRVDPKSGASTELFDPKQAYIWALAPMDDGSIAVATGVEGKLFRIPKGGAGELWFDATETHLRSLAVTKDNRLLVGGAGEGRIYEVSGKNRGRALFDSTFAEISSIYYDASTGLAWAAGASNVLPSAPPTKQGQPQKQATTTTATTTTTSGEVKKEDEPAASVDVNLSFEDLTAANQGTGSAELYRISPDGFVDTVRKLDREIVYGLSGDGKGGLFISTGPLGRIYELRDNEISLLATVPEKQVVSFNSDPGSVIVTTTNSGAVYRLESSPNAKSEYRSLAKDLERFSRFGHFRLEGNELTSSITQVSFRSGNTSSPDDTWSAWSAPVNGSQGAIDVPPSRYLQWRLNFLRPTPSAYVDAVSIAYINRNVAPVIDNVAVLDPGVVIVSSNYPSAPQVVEATNPDENGIFGSLDPSRDHSDPGKRVFRKGYRTAVWKAHDFNNDSIRYTLNFRRNGDAKWLRLRENLEESQYNFDTSQLPDGVYELQLVASDAPDNVEGPLTDQKEGIEFNVDNSQPSVAFTASGDRLTVHVTDQLSTIVKVEYSIDAKKWIRLTPEDGISDSSDETYRIARTDLDNHFVVVRAVDSSFNIATAQWRN